MLKHIVPHPLITDLAMREFLGALHPGPSIFKAISLRWLGQGGLSGLGGGEHWTPPQIIPHRARLSKDPLYIGTPV
jgi:hypothetical protein